MVSMIQFKHTHEFLCTSWPYLVNFYIMLDQTLVWMQLLELSSYGAGTSMSDWAISFMQRQKQKTVWDKFISFIKLNS